MAKIEAIVCDTAGCKMLADGVCAICTRDGCAGHLPFTFAIICHLVQASQSYSGRIHVPTAASKTVRVCETCANIAVSSNPVQREIYNTALDQAVAHAGTLYSARALGAEPEAVTTDPSPLRRLSEAQAQAVGGAAAAYANARRYR
jgi:hypothetical protein